MNRSSGWKFCFLNYAARVHPDASERIIWISRRHSNNLSRTLSSIDEEYIQKPTDQKQVIMKALADNGVHHPLVWKSLLDWYTIIHEGLFHSYPESILTDEMCDRLLTNIYFPSNAPSLSYNCTLAYVPAKYLQPDLLQSLLSRFKESRPDRDGVEFEEKVLLTIKIYLLCKAAQVIFTNNSTKSQRTEVLLAILSYIRSAIFTDLSPSNWKVTRTKDLFWFCRSTFALV